MLFWFEIPCVTWCRALIAEGSEESLREAEERLREYTEMNEAHHNTCQLIGTLALHATACDKQGKGDEAQVLLERALELARPGGNIFPFLELGAPMADLLGRLIEQNRGGEFARRLAARLSDPGRVLPILAANVDETPREST
jgi:LuxR family maltose regulon positive regulatory protein